jgi:hypothetical protein
MDRIKKKRLPKEKREILERIRGNFQMDMVRRVEALKDDPTFRTLRERRRYAELGALERVVYSLAFYFHPEWPGEIQERFPVRIREILERVRDHVSIDEGDVVQRAVDRRKREEAKP